jgi:hypothetical protein
MPRRSCFVRGSEFQRVAQQVAEHLQDPRRIERDRRQPRHDLGRQRHPTSGLGRSFVVKHTRLFTY